MEEALMAPLPSARSTTHGAMRKVDSRLMQQANRALVLNLVRSNATLSRALIARRSGLSQAAVSGIVDRLIRDGLLTEEPVAVTGQVGRRPLRLSFNADARLALGIALEVTEIRVALVDLGGSLRVVHHAPLPSTSSPHDALAIVERLAHTALHEAGNIPVLGVGMAVPGMVQWPEGINLFSPNLGWRNAQLRHESEQRLQRSVLVDNEVRALALAEHHFGVAQDVANAVFLDASYGVGGAIILGGAIYHGTHGAAGEFGHNTIDPRGPRCSCGNYGCLEAFASASGLISRAREALTSGMASQLGNVALEEVSLDHIAEAARSGDGLAIELLTRAATYLGLAVANAIDSWDPELVVLSGDVMNALGMHFDELLASVQRSVVDIGNARVQVRRASIGAHAKLIGAATMVIADYLAAPFQNEPGLPGKTPLIEA